jgi:RNA-dependent RNA polymerase
VTPQIHTTTDIVFDLHTPVIIEKEDYNRTLTGDEQRDNSRYRHRLIAFDDAHAAVAPYAHHLRLTTINEADLHKFHFLCGVAGIPRPFHITQPRFRIEASQRRFFAAPALKRIQRWIASVAWPVAFQIEVLMHNALLNTEDLLDDLHAPIMRHYAADPRKCADLLRHFVERLSSPEHLQPPPGQQRESPFACFRHVEQAKKDKSFDTISSGMFSCRHVTFTPTRLILEGPCVRREHGRTA